jgi:hypothetical protein
MYRDGTGAIGTITVDPVTATSFTLNPISDVVNFEVGMSIVFAADATSALRSGGARTISAINRTTGVITCSAAMDADILSSGSADLVFQAGDYTAADDVLKIRGLEGWCPASAPGSTAFFGVNRTADVTRLGGNRFDGSALPIEEALIEGASTVAREGGSPDVCMVDFATFSNLEKALGSKVVYDEAKARDVDIGFAAISLRGPRGTIKIVPDQNCQPNVAWMLQLDTWSLNTLGEAPMFLDLDNNRMLRENGADAYEVRLGYYGNVACNAPGYNCRVAL